MVCGILVETVAEYWCYRDKKVKPGSLYWTPLPDQIWKIVRPHLAPLFQDKDHIQNMLFIPPHSKPFCGPVCATKHHQENT